MGRIAEIRSVHRQAERLEIAREILAALEAHGWRLGAAAVALRERPTSLQRAIDSCGIREIVEQRGHGRGRPRRRPASNTAKRQ